MSTPRIRYDPLLTRYLVGQGLFVDVPFTLVDVGASGGIEQHWHVFGESLVAFGFDPLVKEVERLNGLNANTSISYHAARIIGPGCGDQQPAEGSDGGTIRDNQAFSRTSAIKAMSLLNVDYVKSNFDPSGAGAMTDHAITLEQFFSGRERADVDFVKVDTDGHDYEVLRGSEQLIDRAPVLGLFVECQFHGIVRDDANLFCNIDRFLRAHGFSLFDVEVYRYSRAQLPKPFVYQLTAQTHGGQVIWGDALYLRDAGDPKYDGMWGIRLDPRKLLKLVCVFEMYGLEDCAAELLCHRRADLEKLVDVERCLDLLTPSWKGKRLSFREYNSRFEYNCREWFPNRADAASRAFKQAIRRIIRRLARA